ncbi:MAG TPA: RNA polymerase sigma factor [Polyangiaceae bacterium]|nr:RNA polymerase sigma factor [Polyangiaceae bacterium]
MIGHPSAYHGQDVEQVPASERRPPAGAYAHAELEGHTLSDEALMAAYVAGDSMAFRELFRRYAPRLRAVLRHESGQDPSDLVQQTFLQLHRARATYQQGAPFRPWLMTIARNLKREQIRRWRRQPRASELPADALAATTASAETALEVRRALSAVNQLPEMEREVLTLHAAAGLSVAETAARLGATQGAVKARAHRAYRRLRSGS